MEAYNRIFRNGGRLDDGVGHDGHDTLTPANVISRLPEITPRRHSSAAVRASEEPTAERPRPNAAGRWWPAHS